VIRTPRKPKTKGPFRLRTVTLNGIAVGEIECTGTIEGNFRAARQLLRRLGLEAPKVSSADRCYSSAFEFATVAFDIMLKHVDKDPTLLSGESLPFAVNAAFSIELFLKALHLLDGVQKHGHKLLGLYNSLPKARRDAIVEAACQAGPHFQQNVDLDPHGYVLRIMSSLNSTFEQWRYIHELRDDQGSGTISTGGTMVAVNACDAACRVGGTNEPPPYHVSVGDYVPSVLQHPSSHPLPDDVRVAVLRSLEPAELPKLELPRQIASSTAQRAASQWEAYRSRLDARNPREVTHDELHTDAQDR
jgi:hypothetical protein